jgi:hypothetical protein
MESGFLRAQQQRSLTARDKHPVSAQRSADIRKCSNMIDPLNGTRCANDAAPGSSLCEPCGGIPRRMPERIQVTKHR